MVKEIKKAYYYTPYLYENMRSEKDQLFICVFKNHANIVDFSYKITLEATCHNCQRKHNIVIDDNHNGVKECDCNAVISCSIYNGNFINIEDETDISLKTTYKNKEVASYEKIMINSLQDIRNAYKVYYKQGIKCYFARGNAIIREFKNLKIDKYNYY